MRIFKFTGSTPESGLHSLVIIAHTREEACQIVEQETGKLEAYSGK